jgi:DNA-binding XRE family transcriptional regulator
MPAAKAVKAADREAAGADKRPPRKRGGAAVKARREPGLRNYKAPIVTYVKRSGAAPPTAEPDGGPPPAPARKPPPRTPKAAAARAKAAAALQSLVLSLRGEAAVTTQDPPARGAAGNPAGAGKRPGPAGCAQAKILWTYPKPVDFDRITGKDVRRIRKLSGLSQQELSRVLGVGVDTFLRWESGTGPLQLRSSSINALKTYYTDSFSF